MDITDEEFQNLLNTKTYVQIADDFDVHENTVRNNAKIRGLKKVDMKRKFPKRKAEKKD